MRECETASGGRSFPRPFRIPASPHSRITAFQAPWIDTVIRIHGWMQH